MVHRWWFHKGHPHHREHHHFPSLIAWPHETSGHKLPPIFLSKKGRAKISTKRKKIPKKNKNHEKKNVKEKIK
jgi:hypothetical protein